MSSEFKIFHHIDQASIDDMYKNYTPVFILTTGRSGSKFVHVLFSGCDEAASYHEAFPTLQYFSNYAFHNHHQHDMMDAMMHAARMEIILQTYNNGKIYIESNQCLTFFAHALKRIYKRAKFIHLIRHPGNFISSAIRKGWHASDTIWESGRLQAANKSQWKNLSQEEKLAWVWNNTNEFIRKFFVGLKREDKMVIRFEDLIKNTEVVHKLLVFAGVQKLPDLEQLIGLQNQKINTLEVHPDEPENMKRRVNYPDYLSWPAGEKHNIKFLVEPLASKYGYEI